MSLKVCPMIPLQVYSRQGKKGPQKDKKEFHSAQFYCNGLGLLESSPDHFTLAVFKYSEISKKIFM